MRTEQEMYDLIINTAIKDERILAVYMNGSRTNSNASRDIFQDYDIVYVVNETGTFRQDKKWIDLFGERLYMQYPEDNGVPLGYDSNRNNCYGWLIQFADGNRLDLHVQTVEFTMENILKDKLCKILLDKDDILPKIPESTDEDYYVKKPTEAELGAVCNEFWWCLNNVAKGLWREEVPYVQDMISYCVRPQLIKVLSWKIGIETNFSSSVGKSGKYIYRWLPVEMWSAFLNTYASGNVNEIWKSVAQMCDLYDSVAKEVSLALNYNYNESEAVNSRSFLEHVRELPKDAEGIY